MAKQRELVRTSGKTVLKLSQVTDFSGVGNYSSEVAFRCGFWEDITLTKSVSEDFTF